MSKPKAKTEAQLAAEREAEAVFASAGTSGIVERAWDVWNDRTRSKALERVARREPALARSFVVFDWARKEGFVRENLRLDHELDVASYGLATRGDPRILPFVVTLVTRSWVGAHLLDPFIDTDRAPSARLLTCARTWLSESRSIDDLDLAARIVERFGDKSDANALASVFDGVLAGVQQAYVDFSTAMARMRSRRTMALLARALIKHGVPASLVPALHHALLDDAVRLEEARGHAALVLASTGQGLDVLERALGDKKPRAGVFTAAAQLAQKAPPAQRAAVTAKIRGVTCDHPYAEAARIAALRDLGEDVSVERAVADALASTKEKDDADAFLCRVAALEMVETRTDVAATLATPFVMSNVVAVHRAAVRALRVRKERVPDYRVYDPIAVLELEERGVGVLAEALGDVRGLYREHIVLALGDQPNETLRAPLVTFARELAATDLADDLSYALRWTVAALARSGGAEAVLDEILLGEKPECVKAILASAHLVPSGLARGMTRALASHDKWTKRGAADWLRKHPSEDTTRALAERGLAPEDLTLLTR